LPPRPPDAHKGTFGTALIIAGSLNYPGAVLLAGEAAYRSGAGLVTLGVSTPLHSSLAGELPEATWLLLPHEQGAIAEDAVDTVISSLGRTSAILFGPGFGLASATQRFVGRLLTEFDAMKESGGDSAGSPLPSFTIDADGLKLMAQYPGWADKLPPPAVLTPHPGEMALLTGRSLVDIQSNRVEIAETYAKQWGHVVVLKGAFTIVAAPDGKTTVIPVASAALARAGTGDVLAGLIVGLRAQGMDAYSASIAGAWIHAQGGLRAQESLGNSACVLAGDVLNGAVDVLGQI
ncbi:MAG: NAD(P)H-hydrate dehydratase, partial [Anaerolineales bacterium]|nr:NAD(P)H-hydrate dehydratase [Anaerolineales bacterium]